MPLVRLSGPLKKLADGRSDHDLEGSTIIDLLRGLEREHGALAGWILDERGHIRRHINVFVNGEKGAADTAVGADDKIDILPAISGG